MWCFIDDQRMPTIQFMWKLLFLKWAKRKFSKFKNLKIGVWVQIGKVWDKRQILPLKKAINKNLSSHPIPIFLIFFSFFLLFSFLYPACATSHSLSPSSSFFPSSPCLPFSLYLAHFDHHQDKHLPCRFATSVGQMESAGAKTP